jgi:hypothetical protein
MGVVAGGAYQDRRRFRKRCERGEQFDPSPAVVRGEEPRDQKSVRLVGRPAQRLFSGMGHDDGMVEICQGRLQAAECGGLVVGEQDAGGHRHRRGSSEGSGNWRHGTCRPVPTKLTIGRGSVNQ